MMGMGEPGPLSLFTWCWSHGCVLLVNIQLYSDGYFSICVFYFIKKLFKKRNGKNC